MSATFRANNGASALELQQHHNWASPGMALEYISLSKPHLQKMAAQIQGIPVGTGPQASTSTGPSTSTATRPSHQPPINENNNLPSAKRVKTDENDNEDDNEGENAIVLSQVIEKSKIGGAVFNFSKCTVNINVTK